MHDLKRSPGPRRSEPYLLALAASGPARCGAAHGFAPSTGFGLVRDTVAKGAYVKQYEVDGELLIGLNLDRIVEEFIKVAKAWKP